MSVTSRYSFRLLQNYTAPPDWKGAFERAKGRIVVIAGADDELMDAEAYPPRAAAARGARDDRSRRQPHGDRLSARGDQGDCRRGGRASSTEPKERALCRSLPPPPGSLLAEFGPLIVFWALAATLGVKPAIAGSILFIARRRGLALAEGSGLHPALSPDQRPDARLRLDRSRLDLAVHAQIRSSRHQCRDGTSLRRRRARRKADHPGGRRAARRKLRRHARDPRLLSPLHAASGPAISLSRPPSIVWIVWTLPMLEAMALRSGDRGRDARPHDRAQRHPRAAAVLPLPPPRPAAQAGCAEPERRGFAGEDGMTIRSDEAAAMLADVDSVVARVKQSRIYRNAALIIILWGVVDLVRDFSSRSALAGSARVGFSSTSSASSARSSCCATARRPSPASPADSRGVRALLRLRLDMV